MLSWVFEMAGVGAGEPARVMEEGRVEGAGPV